MATPSKRKTITLSDGARVTLRPIAPGDKPLLTASFERLSEESRYRRFFTSKSQLSEAELTYLVDVDHKDHEAIIAVEPTSGEALGVARYIRSPDDPSVAEIAVIVADDWQRLGLGRALLQRLTYRARREGVRRFSALVQSDNRASLGLLTGIGDTHRRSETDTTELVIQLPPKRGTGVRLMRALRAAAAGGLVPARTLAHRVAVTVEPSSRPPVRGGYPIRTIVVGADGTERDVKTVAAALELAVALGAVLHVVSAYGVSKGPSDASEAGAVLATAAQAARAAGMEAVEHARGQDSAAALLAVAEEQDADLLVVGSTGMGPARRFVLAKVPDKVSHRAPCSVLIVRAD